MSAPNLYPPIVDTFMPPFINHRWKNDYTDEEPIKAYGECKIYFSLSPYNTSADIKHAQLIVTQQKNNKNALNSKYKAGIKIYEIYKDDKRLSEDKYYIILSGEEMEAIKDTFHRKKEDGTEVEEKVDTTGFWSDTFYKVQLRFSQVAAENDIPDASWFTANLDNFSEWSTVCLIKPIWQPIIEITGVDKNSPTWNMQLQSETLSLNGSITFDGSNTNNHKGSETLKYFIAELYQNENKLETSGYQYVDQYNQNTYNSFTYHFKYNITKDMENVKLKFSYESIGGYTESIEINITPYSGVQTTKPKSIDFCYDEENGCNIIQVIGSDTAPTWTTQENETTNIIIQRSDISSNFNIWEDIFICEDEWEQGQSITIRDMSVEGGKIYKYATCYGKTYAVTDIAYAAQSPRPNFVTGNRKVVERGQKLICNKESLPILDHVYLISNGKQLKIKYNQTINSYNDRFSANKTETIGGKYAFVRQSGNMDYKEFTLNGLISYEADEKNLFWDKDAFWQTNKYGEYHNENPYKDYITEKKFRDEVIKFVKNANAKLFRSMTEGNMIVKATAISLTPNQTLGRLVWDISITFSEVDEDTVENYINYNIYPCIITNETVLSNDTFSSYLVHKGGEL